MRDRIRYIVFLAFFLFASGLCFAQEFKWSWEDEDGSTVKAESLEGEDQDVGSETVNMEGEDRESGGLKVEHKVTGVDVASYNRLLEENLEIRRKLAENELKVEKAQLEKKKLEREIADLEKSLKESVATIKSLRSEVSSPKSDEARKWKEKLAEEEAQKEALEQRLNVLQEKLAASRSEPADQSVDVAEVKVGSSLFKRLEEENFLLKKKLAELDARRKAALERGAKADEIQAAAERRVRGAIKKQEELREQINEKEAAKNKLEKQIQGLISRIPDMEQQVNRLKSQVSVKDSKLEEKEKELAILEEELERREYRLIKAQKMQKLLEQVRKEVREKNLDEKVDLHYNMAVMYMREGRFTDAENEFLKALKEDPTDPDVHYNLGILYDDHLNKQKKAVLHYRKYLKLNPHGRDVDSVKSWLMAIEMKEK